MRSRSIGLETPAETPVRVMLLLGSLSGGGAERVAVNLMNRCDPSKVDLTLGLLKRTGPYLAEIDPRRVAAPAETRTGFFAAARAPADIAAMIGEHAPRVLMSFGMGVNMLAWLALRGLGRRRPLWICREDSNTDAEIANLTNNRAGRAAAGWAVRRAYRSADGLLAVSRDLAAGLARQLAVPPGRVTAIHNPIDLAAIGRSASEALADAPARPFIVAAGRLTHQKGHDLLIDAFAASGSARGMDLVIFGEGPLESALRARAASAGVGDRVRFAGFQANPWAWIARARLFVLSSRWEGFGNVVAEAMACGVPTLVTDCDFGPREQVIHGHSGWVVPAGDAGALAQGLEALLTDPALAARLAAGGQARAADFAADVIAGAYVEFFLKLAGFRADGTATGPRERWRSGRADAMALRPVA